jgi:hypothetical protein
MASERNRPLNGLRVGISGAVPERELWGEAALDRLILSIVAQLTAFVVRYGGRIVHGSQPLLTPVVAEQVRAQRTSNRGCFALFASRLFGEYPEVAEQAAQRADADVFLTERFGPGGPEDALTRNRSLTAMRIAMVRELDVLVAIGGKLHTGTDFNPGVLEELALARWHGIPCFVFGAFGGMAGTLNGPLLELLTEGNLLEGDEDQLNLATWSSGMEAHVGGLLTHLALNSEKLKQNRQASYWDQTIVRATESDSKSPTLIEVPIETVQTYVDRFAELVEVIKSDDVEAQAYSLRDSIYA